MIYDIRIEIEDAPGVNVESIISDLLVDHTYTLRANGVRDKGRLEKTYALRPDRFTTGKLDWRSRKVDWDYPLLEVLADIAYSAGHRKYYGGDSRQDMANYIEWAIEFEELHEKTDWDDGSYIETVDAFAEAKMDAMPKNLPWNVAHVPAAPQEFIRDAVARGATLEIHIGQRPALAEAFTHHNFYNHDDTQWDKLDYAERADTCPDCGDQILPYKTDRL